MMAIITDMTLQIQFDNFGSSKLVHTYSILPYTRGKQGHLFRSFILPTDYVNIFSFANSLGFD